MNYVVPFLGALLVTSLAPALLVTIALRNWRRLPQDPWTERARLLHPIRAAHGGFLFILPFTAIAVHQRWWPDSSSAAAFIGAIVGCTLSGWPLDRALFPEFRFRTWMRSIVVVSAMRLIWVGLVVVFALSMPDVWSLEQLGWAAAFIVASSAISAGLINRVLAACGVLGAASPRLNTIVAECAAEADVRVNRVWEISTPAAYAAALVVQRDLLFSSTTAAEHDDDELRAICRHELAHLKEGAAIVALRVVETPLSLVPFIFIPTLFALLGGVGLFVPVLLWLLLRRGFFKISVALEKRADAAVRMDGNSSAYARALERLHRRNLIPAVLAPKTPRTHPDLYDRMLAAGVIPDFPRPPPPSEGLHSITIVGHLVSAATVIMWLGPLI